MTWGQAFYVTPADQGDSMGSLLLAVMLRKEFDDYSSDDFEALSEMD